MAEKKKPISVKERMKERKKGEEKQKQVEDLVRQAFTQAMPKIDLIFQIAKDAVIGEIDRSLGFIISQSGSIGVEKKEEDENNV